MSVDFQVQLSGCLVSGLLIWRRYMHQLVEDGFRYVYCDDLNSKTALLFRDNRTMRMRMKTVKRKTKKEEEE